MGAQGPATIIAIEPCPRIEPAAPGKRLVTGTFRHAAANVIDLTIEGESQPIGVTDTHPFWSEDRQNFIPAGQLHAGEHLRRADGTLTQVTRITPRRGPPVSVFNLEIDAEHVYHVGTSGVLVHNDCLDYAQDLLEARPNGAIIRMEPTLTLFTGNLPGYPVRGQPFGSSFDRHYFHPAL